MLPAPVMLVFLPALPTRSCSRVPVPHAHPPAYSPLCPYPQCARRLRLHAWHWPWVLAVSVLHTARGWRVYRRLPACPPVRRSAVSAHWAFAQSARCCCARPSVHPSACPLGCVFISRVCVLGICPARSRSVCCCLPAHPLVCPPCVRRPCLHTGHWPCVLAVVVCVALHVTASCVCVSGLARVHLHLPRCPRSARRPHGSHPRPRSALVADPAPAFPARARRPCVHRARAWVLPWPWGARPRLSVARVPTVHPSGTFARWALVVVVERARARAPSVLNVVARKAK